MPDAKRTHDRLLALAGLLFTGLFAMLSFHNRLVIDDWDYLGSLYDTGIMAYVKHLYENWSGRWTGYSLTGFVVSLHDFPYYLAAFNMLGLVFLFTVLDAILKKLLSGFERSTGRRKRALMALTLCMSLFFTSYSKGETWFWLVHVCVYLWSILFSLTLVRILIREKPGIVHWLLLPVAALYIGGASESFALVNIGMTAAYLALLLAGSRSFPVPAWRQTKSALAVALVFLVAGFSVTMLAPGNENRFGALPHVPWYMTIWIQIKSCIKIFLVHTPLFMPGLVFFSIPWLWLGMSLKAVETGKSMKEFLVSIRLKLLTCCAVIFACLLPTAIVMSELGPDRVLSQVTFIIAFAFAYFFFRMGYEVHIRSSIQRMMVPAALVLCGFLVYTIARQYMITRTYAAAYDARWEMLQRLQREGHVDVVTLDPLPPSGYLSAGEITADTDHFANNFLEHALQLGFQVRLRGKEEKLPASKSATGK